LETGAATLSTSIENTKDNTVVALTPREIVASLDQFIVGQAAAKRAVAVALRNRYRRSLLSDEMREDVIPKNILMIGPTGVGKTEIARRLAKIARAPFLKIEATKFTEVGYVGRDVDSIVRDLMQVSVRLVEEEMMAAVQERADAIAVDRIVDILQPRKPRVAQAVGRAAQSAQDQFAEFQRQFGSLFGGASPVEAPPVAPEPATEAPPTAPDQAEREERIRQRLREQVQSGARDDDEIEVELEETSGGTGPTVLPIFGGPGAGMEEGGMDMQSLLGQMMPRRRRSRKLTLREARRLLTAEAARSLVDQDALSREAVRRAQESGIVFIDEIDKIAGRGGEGRGPDVSREGVQRDLLPIIEGSTVQTKYGPVSTNHILFIAAGAFHVAKPSDLIPELQGRLPIRVELESLKEEDFRRILTEPRNALTHQYQALLLTEGIALTFTDDAIAELARIAVDINSRTENIGARRLATVMEHLLEELSFNAGDTPGRAVAIDAVFVRDRLKDVAEDEDLSRYIL
jgi:ATP-dependent HslUV protease ATP-binding subunit HslU